MESLPPPNFDTRGPGIVTCAVVMIVISTTAVVLRFWSRAVESSLVFWWDDWSILVTLFFTLVFLSTNIYWVSIGLGKHSWMIPLSKVDANAITNRIALVFYATVILMIKVSALLLYKRLFKVERRFGLILWGVGILVTAWWVIVVIVPWFSCTPLKKDINPFLPGVCRSFLGWYISSAFINAAMDLVVLLLPMPIIWRLQMSTRRRFFISLVLLLGYCSAFISFARFILIVRNPEMLSANVTADPSWDLDTLLYLSMLEGPFAILALCGPSINQLASRFNKYKTLSSLFTSRPDTAPLNHSSHQNSKVSSSGKRSRNWSKMSSSKNGSGVDNDGEGWEVSGAGMNSTTAIAKGARDDWREVEIPMGRIGVNRDVDVESRREKDIV